MQKLAVSMTANGIEKMNERIEVKEDTDEGYDFTAATGMAVMVVKPVDNHSHSATGATIGTPAGVCYCLTALLDDLPEELFQRTIIAALEHRKALKSARKDA